MTQTATLLPHQQRVVDELSDLCSKIERLDAFLGTPVFEGLPDRDRALLAMQVSVMREYADVLWERIDRF